MENFYLKKITIVNILLIVNIAFCYKSAANHSEDFKELVDKGVFVDKSQFIKEFLECKSKVVFITRPTGFGKSVNLDMLKTFLEMEVDQHGDLQKRNNEIYFQKLKIAEDKKIFNDFFGKYPVIYVSFKDVDAYEPFGKGIEIAVKRAFLQHRYLLQAKTLPDHEKELLSKYFDSNTVLSQHDVECGLEYLKKLLFRHFKKNPFILVDDYDQPLHYVHTITYRSAWTDRHISFVRNFLNIIYNIKNECIERGLICGVSHLPKQSVYINYGDYELNTVFGDKYSTSFGFTKNEVADLLKKLNKSSNLQNTMRRWYGGYYFNDNKFELYNSWSVMKCLGNENNKLDNYLMYANDMIILRHFIDKYSWPMNLFNAIKNLSINGYNKAIMFYRRPSRRVFEKRFHSMGVHFGYLTIDKSGKVKIKVKIPNVEVQNVFSKLMARRFFSINDTEIEQIGHLLHEAVRRKNFTDLISKINSSKFVKKISDLKIKEIGDNSWNIPFDNYIYLFVLMCKYNYDFEIFAKENVKNKTKLDIDVDLVLIPHNSKGSEAYVIISHEASVSLENASELRKNEIVLNQTNSVYKVLSIQYPYIKTVCIINVYFDNLKVEISHDTITL